MTSNDDRAQLLEAEVGHPGRQWDDLLSQVRQDSTLQTFSAIADQWLSLMWCPRPLPVGLKWHRAAWAILVHPLATD